MVKNIVITGASGNLGSRLMEKILKKTDYGIIAILLDFEKDTDFLRRFEPLYEKRIHILKKSELSDIDFKQYCVKCAVHFAFARRICPYEEIADSIDYCKEVFSLFARDGIQRVIYVSSQGVYGNASCFRTETTRPAPSTVYSMAKYAGEKIFEMAFAESGSETCIIRLESIIQSQNLVKALCKDAKTAGEINLKGGKQTFSYLDEEDAVEAFFSLIEMSKPPKSVYNVGPNHMRYTLTEVAACVKEVAFEHGNKVVINIQQDDTQMWAGMESTLFSEDTGWKAKFGLKDMICRVYDNI